MDENQQEDLKALEKNLRLHELQFAQLKQMYTDLGSNINQFMKFTNQTLKLHEEAIGILAARLKKDQKS